MVTLEADRFTRTVAPASAARLDGGTGTHTSSQISACSTNAGTLVAWNISRVPKGTTTPPMDTSVANACAAGWNCRAS